MGQNDTSDVTIVNRKGKKRSKAPKQDQQHDDLNACQYCDRNHPRQKKLYPAYRNICGKWGKPNHLASVCRSSREPGKPVERNGSRKTRTKAKRDIRSIFNTQIGNRRFRQRHRSRNRLLG